MRPEQLVDRKAVTLKGLICGPSMSFNSPIGSYNSGDAYTTRSIVMLMGPARRSDLPLSLARASTSGRLRMGALSP